MPDPAHDLAAALRAQRRDRRLSLRDLAAEIDVSFNTLSRVERGHIPDLPNYRKIAAWLKIPTDAFLEPAAPTPDVIARHLNADKSLSTEAAATIASVVEEMYAKLTIEQPRVACHLRSAQTFTPRAGELLAGMLSEMQDRLLQQS
jgi:transcriptional regulator with XRE-family HTH domain